MNAWADIGAGIRAVEPSHNFGKDIAASKSVKVRAQIMAIWPDSISN